jgi:hypothetical protein
MKMEDKKAVTGHDKWFNAIVNALKNSKSHPDERRAAIVRAGLIAQAYAGADGETLTEVFGSDFSDNTLQDSKNHNSADL